MTLVAVSPDLSFKHIKILMCNYYCKITNTSIYTGISSSSRKRLFMQILVSIMLPFCDFEVSVMLPFSKILGHPLWIVMSERNILQYNSNKTWFSSESKVRQNLFRARSLIFSKRGQISLENLITRKNFKTDIIGLRYILNRSKSSPIKKYCRNIFVCVIFRLM